MRARSSSVSKGRGDRHHRMRGGLAPGYVSTEEKARVAHESGCEIPIVTRDYRFAEAVKQASGGRGADVVYDGLGGAAAVENLAALALRGHWVSYGQTTGVPDSLPTVELTSKSITLSRPVVFHYTEERAALEEIARNCFAALRNGTLRVAVRHRYRLAAALDPRGHSSCGRRGSGPSACRG